MSFVNTPAAKPNVVSFALSITSSTVLNFRIDWTGPNIYANKITPVAATIFVQSFPKLANVPLFKVAKSKVATHLLSGYLHFVGNICKHSRLDKITFITNIASTAFQGSTFAFPRVDHAKHFLVLGFVHLYSELHVFIYIVLNRELIQWFIHSFIASTLNLMSQSHAE